MTANKAFFLGVITLLVILVLNGAFWKDKDHEESRNTRIYTRR